MSFTELEQQIINYDKQNDCSLELYSDDGIDKPRLKDYVQAVKCFQHYHPDEFTVDQILNKFIGKWDNRDAYVEVALLEHCVEEMIQEITIPCPNGSVPMFLECLDYSRVWETMSRMETVLKGYVNIWSENNPDFDHCFYVYDMTR